MRLIGCTPNRGAVKCSHSSTDCPTHNMGSFLLLLFALQLAPYTWGQPGRFNKCHGVEISRNAFLTTAYCATQHKTHWMSSFRNVTVHPMFQTTPHLSYDIAVMRLTLADNRVRSRPLNIADSRPPVGSTAYASDCRSMAEPVKIISNIQCQMSGRRVPKDTICALASSLVTLCMPMMGSALLVGRTLAGIFREDGGVYRGRRLLLYTSTSVYRTWILRTLHTPPILRTQPIQGGPTVQKPTQGGPAIPEAQTKELPIIVEGPIILAEPTILDAPIYSEPPIWNRRTSSESNETSLVISSTKTPENSISVRSLQDSPPSDQGNKTEGPGNKQDSKNGTSSAAVASEDSKGQDNIAPDSDGLESDGNEEEDERDEYIDDDEEYDDFYDTMKPLRRNSLDLSSRARPRTRHGAWPDSDQYGWENQQGGWRQCDYYCCRPKPHQYQYPARRPKLVEVLPV